MKLNKTETLAFEALGEAICNAKTSIRNKKAAMPLVNTVMKENREAFLAGIVIGNYRFQLVQRDELTAIKVD